MECSKILSKLRDLFITRSEFARNVATLSCATVFAQLINILMMPILARLYTPSDFGVLSLFSSILGILATISGFRFYLVIPIARRTRYVHAILILSVFAQLICVVLITFIIFIFSDTLLIGHYYSLYNYRYLIPIGVLTMGIYSMLVQWAIREKEFVLIANTKLTQTAARAIFNFAFAFLGWKPLGLLLGNIAGESSGILSLSKKLLKKEKIVCNVVCVKRSAISYRDMFFCSTPSGLINMSGAYLLPWMIAYFFSNKVLGSYSMAQNVLVLPSAVLGTAIGQVFQQKAADSLHSGNIAVVSLKCFGALGSVGMFPVLAGSFLAPSVLPIILGPEWNEAGGFAKILAPWIALGFIYSPLSSLYAVLMLQKLGLVFVCFYTFSRLLSVYIGRLDVVLSLICLSFSGSVLLIIGIHFILLKAGNSLKDILMQTRNMSIELFIEMSPFLILYLLKKRGLRYDVFALFIGTLFYLYFIKKHFLMKSSR